MSATCNKDEYGYICGVVNGDDKEKRVNGNDKSHQVLNTYTKAHATYNDLNKNYEEINNLNKVFKNENQKIRDTLQNRTLSFETEIKNLLQEQQEYTDNYNRLRRENEELRKVNEELINTNEKMANADNPSVSPENTRDEIKELYARNEQLKNDDDINLGLV